MDQTVSIFTDELTRVRPITSNGARCIAIAPDDGIGSVYLHVSERAIGSRGEAGVAVLDQLIAAAIEVRRALLVDLYRFGKVPAGHEREAMDAWAVEQLRASGPFTAPWVDVPIAGQHPDAPAPRAAGPDDDGPDDDEPDDADEWDPDERVRDAPLVAGRIAP